MPPASRGCSRCTACDWCCVGGAIGVAASLLAARFLATLLFGVGTFDPVALTGAPLVLGVAAWLAAYLPARRASRVDPLAALRAD